MGIAVLIRGALTARPRQRGRGGRKLLCGEAPPALTIGQVSAKREFDWRPLSAGQSGAWASLLAAIEAVDHQDETMGEEDLREEFDDPTQDFDRGSVAVYDGSAMIAYCVLTPRCSGGAAQEAGQNAAQNAGQNAGQEPRHQVRHEGGVHPAYRERGLGSALLGWAEETAGPLHDGRHPGRPLSLSGRFPTRLADASALFTANGYEPTRWFLRMTADLRGAMDDPPAPDGIRVVPFTQDRAADSLLVRNEAFRDHWGSVDYSPQEWAHFMRFQAFRPAFSFLAYQGADPVGLVLSHEYEEYNRLVGYRDLYIALVGTRRAARHRGIGSALLRHALATARADGVASAALDVDADSPSGAVGIYERIGFSVRDNWVTQTKQLAA
jgi:mycothiol synthase